MCYNVHVQSLSHVWLSATPWTVARQAPLSMGFTRQEHWSGLPCPPPGHLPDPGIKSASPRYLCIYMCIGSNALATWCKELTHWKRPWCWERLKAGGEGDDRGWYAWTASLTWWTWVWANSGSWWWTGRPGVLQSVGSQRVRHYWATELKTEKANQSPHSITSGGNS